MTWVLGDRLSCWMKESVSVDLASWRRCSVAIGMVMGVEVELIQRRVMEGFREVDYSGVFEIKVALEALGVLCRLGDFIAEKAARRCRGSLEPGLSTGLAASYFERQIGWFSCISH